MSRSVRSALPDGGRRRPAPIVVGIMLAALVFPAPTLADCNGADTPGDACTLALGESSTGTQTAQQTVRYRLAVPAGMPVAVQLWPDGLDLQLEIVSADGVARRLRAPHRRDGVVRFAVDGAATYEIAIVSDEFTAASGRHRILARALDLPSDSLDAWRQETRAGALSAAAEAADVDAHAAWQLAFDAWVTVAANWAALGDTAGAANASMAAAWIEYMQLWNWSGAADRAALAARRHNDAGHRTRAANALQLQAAALLEAANESDAGQREARQRKFANAFKLLEQALAMHESLGNRYDAAIVRNNVGLGHYYLGDYTTAGRYWRRAAATLNELGETGDEFNALANLAVIEYERHNLIGAIETYRRLLAAFPPDEDAGYRADTLSNLGVSQTVLGRFDEALKSQTAALRLYEQLDSAKGRAGALAGIAAAYYGGGEFGYARDYLEEALPLARAASDGRSESWVLRYLGNLDRRDGNLAAAIARHRQALLQAHADTDRAPLAVALARDLVADDELAQALETLEAEREKLDDSPARIERARVLAEIARLHNHDGAYALAEQTAGEALALFRDLGDLEGQAGALLSVSHSLWHRGMQQRAIDQARASVAAREALRGRLADPELRATYLATQRRHYEWLITMLMQRDAPGDVAAALQVAERTRARLTIDLLGEVAAGIDTGETNELVQQRRTLLEQLSVLRYRLGKNSDDGELNNALRRIETDLHVVNAQLRRRNPRYAAVTDPPLLSSAGIQAMLGDDTSLLQYFVGDEHVYLWLVSATGIDGHSLPGAAAVQDGARALHDQLRRRPDSRRRAERAAAIAEVSELILAPVAASLHGSRLLVAADGALHLLPFAILQLPGADGPLLQRFEIAQIPSMTASAAQQLALADRLPPTKTLAVFADPVFDTGDPRFDSDRQASLQLASAIESRAPATTLMRLPSTALEARRIAALVGKNRRHIATGFDASLEGLRAVQLDQYRVVHFATHAVIDARYPALSALALSHYDADGKPRDGLLRLHQVFGLRLNADLVTLSACETSLGREIAGESLVGLTLGFRYAGAREIVGTLWPVADRASAELMRRFYRAYLGDGVSAPAALRRAQRAMASKTRYADPFYWSGFVVH